MRLPFTLKWLGAETAEVCSLLAPFQPLIHVSRTPSFEKPPPGLIALPHRVTRTLDLRRAAATLCPAAGRDAAESRGPVFEISRLEYTSRELAAVYEFYFEVYMRYTSLGYLRGQTLYTYVDWLHRDLLGHRFVAFARARVGGRVVAGCLLRRFSAAGVYDGDGPSEADGALVEGNTVELALCAADPQSEDSDLQARLLECVADWARREGYSFLAAATEPGLVVDGDNEDAAWLYGITTTPVLHRSLGALLYCDLNRCAYLSQDFYFYSCEGPEPCLHYVANIPPGASQAIPFLRSLERIRKLAHTRRPETQRALSQAGFDCELLRQG